MLLASSSSASASGLLQLALRGALLRAPYSTPPASATPGGESPLITPEISSKTANRPRRWRAKTGLPFQNELTNPVGELMGAEHKEENGYAFDKKPFKVSVKKYHLYEWCGCGLSSTQPFCDRTHASRYIKGMVKGGPVKYVAPEDKDIWFCNCKQTANRPFCDGTHRRKEIQDMLIPGKTELFEPKQKKKTKKQ